MATVRNRWTPTTKRVVVSVVIAAAILLLVRVDAVVPPFLWAFVVGYVLLPAVAFIERRLRVGRGLAAGIVFLGLLAFIVSVVRLVAPLAAAELRDAQHVLPVLVRNAQLTLAEWLRDLNMGDLDALVLVQAPAELAAGLGRTVVPFATAVGRLTIELLLFLVASFFVLRDAPRLFVFLREQLPSSQQREILHIADQVNSLISRYIRGQLVLVGIMSTVTAIGLSLLEVPYSIVLGFVTGVLELIPIAGPITAGAIASIVALGHPDPFGWSQLVYVGAVVVMYTILRYAEDYLVVPYVIGRIVRLHPLVVIFSLLAGGAVFGLLGILLAVPAAATLRLVLVYVFAKLRDEDPLPELEREIEAVGSGHEPAVGARTAGGPART